MPAVDCSELPSAAHTSSEDPAPSRDIATHSEVTVSSPPVLIDSARSATPSMAERDAANSASGVQDASLPADPASIETHSSPTVPAPNPTFVRESMASAAQTVDLEVSSSNIAQLASDNLTSSPPASDNKDVQGSSTSEIVTTKASPTHGADSASPAVSDGIHTADSINLQVGSGPTTASRSCSIATQTDGDDTASDSHTCSSSPQSAKTARATSPPTSDLSTTTSSAAEKGIPISKFNLEEHLATQVDAKKDYYPEMRLMDVMALMLKAEEDFFKNGTWGQKVPKTIPDFMNYQWHKEENRKTGMQFVTYKVRERKMEVSMDIKNIEVQAYNADPIRERNFRWPPRKVNAKNATDPLICADLQPTSVVLGSKAELQEAVEAWRDTVDGLAEDFYDTVSGENWWRYMNYEDFNGTDNNNYHDYFPSVPPTKVYHSTGTQTLPTFFKPKVHELCYGYKPSEEETITVLRRLYDPTFEKRRFYFGERPLYYGKPFLSPYGPYPDTQTKTEESGFQTMSYDIREANILKAKAKAALTASKVNKICLEKKRGIRVYAQPNKDKILHSQQFHTAVKISRDGTVEDTGSFIPMIPNILYEDKDIIAELLKADIEQPPESISPSPSPTACSFDELHPILSYCPSPSPEREDFARTADFAHDARGWAGKIRYPTKEQFEAYAKNVDVFMVDISPVATKTAVQFGGEVRPRSPSHGGLHQNSSSQAQAIRHSSSRDICQDSFSRGGIHQDSSTPSEIHQGPTPTLEPNKASSKKRSIEEHQYSDSGSTSPALSQNKRQKRETQTSLKTSPPVTPSSTSRRPGTTPKSTSALTPPTAPEKKAAPQVSAQGSRKRKQEAPAANEHTAPPNPKRHRTEKPALGTSESTLKVIEPENGFRTTPRHFGKEPTPPPAKSSVKGSERITQTQPAKTQRVESSQRTQKVESSQRTQKAESSQRTQKAESSQRTQKAESSQRTQKAESSQRTQNKPEPAKPQQVEQTPVPAWKQKRPSAKREEVRKDRFKLNFTPYPVSRGDRPARRN